MDVRDLECHLKWSGLSLLALRLLKTDLSLGHLSSCTEPISSVSSALLSKNILHLPHTVLPPFHS